MDRRHFLQRFGMGAAAVIITPTILTSSIIKGEDKIIAPGFLKESRMWRNSSIWIRVINNNPDPTEVMLFGANKNISGNFIPEGIKIQVAGSNYQNLQNSILYNPIRIDGFRIQAKSMNQLHNGLTIFNEGVNGSLSSQIFQPHNYMRTIETMADVKPAFIECPDFELLLTPSIYMIQKINPNEQVDYVFNIATKKSSIL